MKAPRFEEEKEVNGHLALGFERHMNDRKPTKREEELAREIVDAAYLVHTQLGPGLLEKIYEVCFCHELSKKGINTRRQVSVPIRYDGLTFDEGLRLDVLVEDLILSVFESSWLNKLKTLASL